MRFKLSLLFFATILYSSSTSGQQIDLKISDKIEVLKSSQHVNIPETQLLFIKPNELVYNKTFNRYEADTNTFITVIYTLKNRNISDEIIAYKGIIKNSENKGLFAFYWKEFASNTSKALIAYSSSDKAGLEQLSLVIGNEQNSYVLKGYFPSQNQKSRDFILKSLLSIIIDNSIKLDTRFKYSLDLTKSLFKLNEVDGEVHYYTINGKGDLQKNYVQNQILIQALPAYPTLEARKRYNDSMMERFKKSLKISNLIENEVTINGIKGLESSYTATESRGLSSKNYQLVIGNENETIFITGMAYTNKEITFNQFKELIKTLKLK